MTSRSCGWSGNQAPDYRSLARFRRGHLDALPGLFLRVLHILAQAGLVRLGRVALDGTNLSANSSRHKAMSYDRIGSKIDQLQAEVNALLAETEAVDEAEDQEYGADRRGDEVSPEFARREGRLAKLGAAKEALEADAADKAEAAARKKAGPGEQPGERGRCEDSGGAKTESSTQLHRSRGANDEDGLRVRLRVQRAGCCR